MAGRVDVGSRLVYGRMDRKTSCVDCDSVASHNLTFFVDLNHIACFEHAEVDPQAGIPGQ